MKKLIQISALLSLVVLFTTVSTFAQSYGTDVKIPFAFVVGDRSYEAGEYIVKIEKLGPGTAALSIRDTKTDEVQRVLMNVNGDDATGDVNLIFDKVDGQRRLTKVATPDRTYAIIKTKAERDAARARNAEKSVTVGGVN